MLGYRFNRVRSFTMIHAAVLVALIGVAQIIHPIVATSEARVSVIQDAKPGELLNGRTELVHVRANIYRFDYGVVSSVWTISNLEGASMQTKTVWTFKRMVNRSDIGTDL